eukprot:TCONS_00008338-protein
MDDISILAVKSALFNKNESATSTELQKLPLPPLTPPKKTPVEKDLNDILSKVQNDIQLIKNNVLANLSDGESIDPERIKLLFEKAEKDIEVRKQDVINQFNDKALSQSKLNLVKASPQNRSSEDDEKPKSKQIFNQTKPSPGQKFSAIHKLKGIINPARSDARALLNKHYNVPLPVETKDKHVDKTPPRPVTGTTIVSTPMVPKENQLNGRLTPPPATADDKRKGVVHLIERKIIPVASRLSIMPPPINQKQAVLHSPLDFKKYKQDQASSKLTYNMALVRFDPGVLSRAAMEIRKKRSMISSGRSFASSRTPDPSKTELTSRAESVETHNNINLLEHNVSTVDGRPNAGAPLPAILSDPKSRPIHRFIIQQGQTDTSKQDFIIFKQYYCLSWGSILSLIHRLEKMLIDFSVPIAVVDGDKLADMALYFECGPKPTIRDLLLCILNTEDVEKLIMIPGRRYMAPDGQERAAIKIQSTWRCHVKHSTYLEYRRRKWGAGMIALNWIMHCKMSMIRKELRTNQVQYLQNARVRAKKLEADWQRLKTSKRLIIHIPSLGYSPSVRQTILNIATLQNNQIGRIFDIKDPNVEVIYISPVPMKSELKDYYHRLIDIAAEVTGQDTDEMKSRLKIITPLQYEGFPAHNLCLASIFKYSTRTIERIKKLIKGKEAYIVPGMTHDDDYYLAEQFDIPILGTEPDIAKLYSMKSGVCRVFEAAGVSRPPEEHDIYSLQQLYQSLARLIAENLSIKRWLLKIDNEIDGRGTAYIDIAEHLNCYGMALREREKYGEKWSQPWCYESTYNAILIELPHILEKELVIIDEFLFPKSSNFLKIFCRNGGILQACPPTDSVTGITANVLIEPDGQLKIISIADQVHSNSQYRCWGFTLPQSSIQPEIIKEAIWTICQACMNREIIGYVTIDFVTFLDPDTNSQVLWAVDLKIMYSTSNSMIQMMQFMSDCDYDVTKNTLTARIQRTIHPKMSYRSKRKNKETLPKEIVENLARHCVFSGKMFHSNLNNVHYGVFFQMCKARGIGYDEKTRLGTTFTLLDKIRKESVGMLTLGETLEDTIRTFASNLQIIHNDISSPVMIGKHNFQGAIDDLRSILTSLQVNSELDQNSYPTLDPYQRELVLSVRNNTPQSGNIGEN